MKPAQLLAELHAIAAANGGKCLATEWIKAKAKYEFEFADGRRFFMTGDSIKRKGWPQDPERYFAIASSCTTYRLEHLRRIASENNWDLVDQKWIGVLGLYRFRNSAGREFVTSYKSLQAGWPADIDRFLRLAAPTPFQQKQSYEQLKALGQKHGCEILTPHWLGSQGFHRFKAHDGLEFEVKPNVVFGKKGWPKNTKSLHRRQNPEVYLDEMNAIASTFGGRLISKKWGGTKSSHEFEDQYGFRFMLTYSALKRGSWTPARGCVSEYLCRLAMQHIFGQDFPSRWDIVTREDSRNLQLDGFAEGVVTQFGVFDIGFEYQGHHAHRENSSVRERDAYKVEFTRNRQTPTVLVVIERLRPKNSWEVEYVLRHVLDAVNTAFAPYGAKTSPINAASGFSFDVKNVYHGIESLKKLKLAATSNGGDLLSTRWLGSNTPHEFQFANGRRFRLSPDHLESRGWPKNPDIFLRRAAGKDAIHFEFLRELAAKNGGRLLETQWLGSETAHRFEAHDGRVFMIQPNNLRMRGWPKKHLPMTLKANPKADARHKDLEAIAVKNGGRLLETQWLGSVTPHRFAAHDGAIFSIRPGNLKNQGWPKRHAKPIEIGQQIPLFCVENLALATYNDKQEQQEI